MVKACFLASMAVMAAGFTACSSDVEVVGQEQTGSPGEKGLQLAFVEQQGLDVQLSEGAYKFTNKLTGEVFTVAYGGNVSDVPDGTYDVVFNGKGFVPSATRGGSGTEVVVYGGLDGVTVAEGRLDLALPVYANGVDATKNFLITEIFPSGTKTADNKQYNGGDQYLVIGNNTKEALDISGLVIVESSFTNTTKQEYTPDILSEALPVSAVMMVPNDGKKRLVQPGETYTICDNAIDHTAVNPNSIDLSGAQMEWYMNRPAAPAAVKDKPTAGKESLTEIYNVTKTLWLLSKQGNRTYAIGRLPEGMTKEQYLKDYTYDYQYPIKGDTLSRVMHTYRFPNEWIIDAVNLAPKDKAVWHLSPLDQKYTYVGTTTAPTAHYDMAVIRVQDKFGVWVDANNSEKDFKPAQKASYFTKK